MRKHVAGEATAAGERYERERSFHDERFGGDSERAADRFYAVNIACERYFAALLDAASPGDRALEYGCGTGSSAFALATRSVEVDGIDLSPVAVSEGGRVAQSLGLESVRFHVMNAEALDFGDETFDLVCGSGILHHLDVELALPELRRVLAPSGRAVFVEPLGHNPLINTYRRITPGMRTPDEHPLLQRDIAGFGRWFGRVESRSFVLVALLALPLRNWRYFPTVLGALNSVDAAIFRRLPRLARYAWTVVIELSEPVAVRGTS